MATLNIYQLENGYCYNTDSLILAHFAKSFLKKHISLLDVGAGSGVLGMLCSREILSMGGSITLHLVEKDTIMATLAQKNTSIFSGKVHCVDFMDFVAPFKFDFIITNPPFYTQGAVQGKNQRKNMARHQSFLPLHPMLEQIKRVMKPNGILCMCYDARMCDEVFYGFKECDIHIDVVRFVHSLPDRESTLMLLKAKIQSKSPLRILPPLFTHQSPIQSDNTLEVKRIYEWAQTQSIKINEEQIRLEEYNL
ncbi:methyltransferase [Helicobacter hepaticus]|jgi:tRNA1(Val) A37 N6-methylase TrmN6|uniref:Methyltransferase small domain-containing protein n=1 Tax=Helicobacter hepaticus (strain ATCC 51449 / 3B1) TaxID=235279 RepID=Q7VHX5_HELHP|nr:methyltransferase [Helicobacter hepaticus]AAP77434.1 conserved hypothetical protein [Helicobacter hepaticus ATCC 51449]